MRRIVNINKQLLLEEHFAMSIRIILASLLPLFMVTLLTVPLSGQVFRGFSPPPPPPEPGTQARSSAHEDQKVVHLDTLYQQWEVEEVQQLVMDDLTNWEVQLPSYSHGISAKNEQFIGIAAVETIYTDGYTSDSKLHLNTYDLRGNAIGHFTLSHPPGISVKAIVADSENFYLAYEKSINSGDRDMYIAKINTKGQLQWETKIGKRFGTSGTQLLQIDPQGNVVLFAQMYQEVGFDILSPQGEIIDRKMLYFQEEFSPASFFYQKDGSIVALGTYKSYPNRKSESSSILFTLDTAYQVVQYRQVQSPYTDQALSVTTDDQGHYYCLTNSLNYQAPYDKRANFSTITKFNDQLEIIDTLQFLNTQTGLQLQLQWHPQHGLWAYQRLYNQGQTFALFQLSADLLIENIWSKKGHFSDPHFLEIVDDTLYLGGGSRDSWLLVKSLISGTK